MRTQRRLRFFALALVPLCGGGLLLTRPGAPLHAQSVPSDPPKTVDCQSGTAQWISAPHTAELGSGVQFSQDDAVLKTNAAVALFDKDNNVISAKAQGPVHIYDPQDDLVGQHGSVDFTKHLATLTDNIVLVVKPGKREAAAGDASLRKQFKDPATLTCQKMTYDYRFKVGRIPGPLTVTQTVQTKDGSPQTRILTADAGLYNGKAETVQLVGDVKVTFSDGSIVEGDTRPKGKPVLINIKEGAEAITVPFDTKGHFTVKPQAKSSKDDASDDDGPDLSLPVPPPHAPAPSGSPAAPAPAPPAPASPAPSSQAEPGQTLAPAPPAQTPAAAPAGRP